MAQTSQPKSAITPPAKTQLTGIVRIESAGEYPPVNMQQLTVKVFQATLSAGKLLLTLVPDENGMFAGEITAVPGIALTADLYLNASTGRGEAQLAAESGPYNPAGGYVYVEFKYDPAKFSGPLYTWVKASVTPQLGKTKLSALTDKQLEQLRCVTGISQRTLTRLVNAEILFNSLQANTRSCTAKMKTALKQKGADNAYLEEAIANMALLSNEDNIAPILFAALRDDNSLDLYQMLTTCAAQLKQMIGDAVDNNTIAPVSNATPIIDGLIALRNCLLLNSSNDNYFYDAKLIYLASLDMATKSSLLDSVIDAGSLSGFLGNEDSQNSPVTRNSN